VITWIEWKMDGWIELSGCGKWMWMWKVDSGKWMWKVESGAAPDLTLVKYDVHTTRKINSIHAIFYHILSFSCSKTRRLSHEVWKSTGPDRTSQGGNNSPICGEAPTVPIVTKICMAGILADIITCVKFQDEIFRGYDFTGGVEFPIFLLIFLLIFVCALQQCSAIACNRGNFWPRSQKIEKRMSIQMTSLSPAKCACEKNREKSLNFIS